MRADARIGVVVLTHNRAQEAIRTLERLRALPEQPCIVVVDNASQDGTTDLLRRRFPDVRCLRLATNAGAAGRNIGVGACDRPFIALCDDDTWWEPGSLRHAADLLESHRQLAVVTAMVLVREEERTDSTSLEMGRSPLRPAPGLPGAPLLGFLAGASMVRRSAFLQVGGFEPRLFLGAEEQLLAIDLARAGWALAYVEDLFVHHYPSSQRDAKGRLRLLERNHLWIAWLRRPLGHALRLTARSARRSLRDPVARAAIKEALLGLPWAIRCRRVVSPELEQQLRLLDDEC